MSLPRGLPQISDLGSLASLLGNDGLVDQSLIDVPYTTITNRAQIPDLSNDLKPRMGIERIMTQSAYRLQDEFGPNGEPVWGVVNDTLGLVRLVGPGWTSVVDGSGQRVRSTVTNDYYEITFYGTGLNILAYANTSVDNRVTVDGGAEGGSTIIPAGSTVSQSRNYSPNVIIPVTSNLTLGIHTIKIKNYSAGGTGFNLNGFEILNESSSIKTTPGSAFIEGKRLTSSAQNVSSYNSGFETGTLGTKGGRVLVYQKSDGSIAKAVTPTNASIGYGYLSTVDHTNEDIVRSYMIREFGAGRFTGNDDFSLLNTTNSARAFTLDDGTTTLVSPTAAIFENGGVEYLGVSNGSYVVFTFVGTGLDIQTANTGGTGAAYSITLEGGLGSVEPSPWPVNGSVLKVVSGLPYGTHTVKISRNDANNFSIAAFIVYQPKKPSLPDGAIELADYNILANYSQANEGAILDGRNTVGTGVLRKFNVRENVYVGTWAGPTIDITNFGSGWTISCAVATGYVEYTFFGTGIVHSSLSTAAALNQTITIDGLALNAGSNIGSTVTLSQASSGITLSAAGVLGGTSAAIQRFKVSISGLALGKHTIRITQNTTTVPIYADAFDIITPIHSQKSNLYANVQNTLPVGSQAISDNRKITALSGSISSTKAWAQAVGLTSSPTTTSASYLPMPDMSCTIKTSGGSLKITYSIELNHNTAGTGSSLRIYVDGVQVSVPKGHTASSVGGSFTLSEIIRIPVSEGIHKVDVAWQTAGGTLTATTTRRILLVEEVE